MTDFSDLLLPQTVIEQISAANKKALFQQLAVAAADAYGVDAKAVTAGLAKREKLGSTGFGGGIAIPHGKLAGIIAPMAVFARLSHPIDFESVDDLPVDLVFLLLSPIDSGAVHLKTLARVSRALRDTTLAAKLRGAGSRDALYALLTADDARDAA